MYNASFRSLEIFRREGSTLQYYTAVLLVSGYFMLSDLKYTPWKGVEGKPINNSNSSSVNHHGKLTRLNVFGFILLELSDKEVSLR